MNPILGKLLFDLGSEAVKLLIHEAVDALQDKEDNDFHAAESVKALTGKTKFENEKPLEDAAVELATAVTKAIID